MDIVVQLFDTQRLRWQGEAGGIYVVAEAEEIWKREALPDFALSKR
jgi:hypothetical protein